MPASKSHCPCEEKRRCFHQATVFRRIVRLSQQSQRGNWSRVRPGKTAVPLFRAGANRLRQLERRIPRPPAANTEAANKRRDRKGKTRVSGRAIEEREHYKSMRLCAGGTQTTSHRRASLLFPFRSDINSFRTRSFFQKVFSNNSFLCPGCCADIPRAVAPCGIKTRMFDKALSEHEHHNEPVARTAKCSGSSAS